MDVPSQVAFFILGYAKLRMLQYVYDFLNKVIMNHWGRTRKLN